MQLETSTCPMHREGIVVDHTLNPSCVATSTRHNPSYTCWRLARGRASRGGGGGGGVRVRDVAWKEFQKGWRDSSLLSRNELGSRRDEQE